MCFHLDESTGNVRFFINGSLVTDCLFSVDITQQLYFFFDICGKINAIRLIPQCRSSTPNPTSQIQTQQLQTQTANQSPTSSSSSTANNTTTTSNTNKRQSALIDYFKSQLIADAANGGQDIARLEVEVSCGTNGVSKLGDSPNRAATANGSREECRICWDAPIECVFYACGHMCLCWNW